MYEQKFTYTSIIRLPISVINAIVDVYSLPYASIMRKFYGESNAVEFDLGIIATLTILFGSIHQLFKRDACLFAISLIGELTGALARLA